MSDYEQKYLAAIREMKAAGIWPNNANPPFVRWLRNMGFEPRPPHYVPFKTMLQIQSSIFALGWGIFMYFIAWRGQDVAISMIIVSSFLAGITFGLAMALYYLWGRNQHQLTDWDKL